MECRSVVLLLVAASLSCSLAQQTRRTCPNGEFYSSANNSCVTECPCGMYGDATRAMCRQGNEMFFSKIRLNITGSADNRWRFPIIHLAIEDNLLKNNSNVFRFYHRIIPNSIYNSYYTLQSFFRSNLEIQFSEQIPQNQYVNIASLTATNPNSCSTVGNRTYFYFPVQMYLTGNITGLVTIRLYANIMINTVSARLWKYASTYVYLTIDNGCSGDLLYEFSSGKCVETCSQCAISVAGSCQSFAKIGNVFIGSDHGFTKNITVFSMTPQSAPGSLLGNVDIYINEAVITDTTILTVSENVLSIVQHNHSDVLVRHYHNIRPTFRLTANNTFSSQMSDYSITFNASSLAKLRDSLSIQCADGTTRYLILKLNLVLTSDSLYHLGDHEVQVRGFISGNNRQFDKKVKLRVQAECNDQSLLYDFATHECVSQCSCGHAPFRRHSTAYCEAGAYYDLAQFLNEQSMVQIPFNAPPTIITTNISIYINFPELNDYIRWFGNENSTVVARLSVVSSYSGIDLPVNNTIVPVVTLTAPNGTESMTVDILLNINESHIERCYDSFLNQSHTLVNVPVNIHSPLMYTQLGEYNFTVTMHLISSTADDTFLHFLFQYYGKDAYIVTVNITNNGNETVSGPNSQQIYEGVNYLSFLELDDHMQELPKDQDSSSPAITIPTGLPFDNSVQTQAFVNENGIISFANPWPYSSPSRFPTSWYWTRNQYVVAPFWSDNDIRRSGSVHYANITLGDSDHGDELINTVSKFIQHQNDEAAEQSFTGQWMLVAYWDSVHPYPHGSDSSYYYNYYGGFTQKDNSYQALVITDGANTYTVFTYNCNMMGWSGYWQHAVVGYNGRGNSYTNHPASGFDVIKTAVACPNNLLYQVPWNNIVYKISPPPDQKMMLVQQCNGLFRQDYRVVRLRSLNDISEELEPCPCTAWQAWRDWGTFRREFSQGLCFVQRSTFTQQTRGSEKRFTQKCCYAPWGSTEAGSLLTSGIDGSSMLYLNPDYADSFEYDRKFKDTCCGLAQRCNTYYRRRPADECTNYDPPERTWGWGDPHITTLDGRTYTFNGWGEYTLLEPASNTTQFVLQGRTSPVNESTSNSATQFSAFAFGIPEEISFQVGIGQGEFVVYRTEDSDENITGYLSQVNGTYNVSDGDTEAELTRQDQDTIIATFSNGVGCTFTKSVGILNFVLALPRLFMGQTRGLLGNNNGNKTDDFMMRGATHSLPDNLTDEEIFSFGKSWTVPESESLFSYDGSSYAMFHHPDHTPVFVAQLNPTSEQIAVCGEDKQCLYDFVQTGNEEIAVSTMKTAETNEMDSMILNNFPPNITAKDTFTVMVGQNNVFNFTVEDIDSNITVGLVRGLPTGASIVSNGGSQYSLHYRPTVVTNNETLTIIATDPHSASSTITPRLYLCACANGGSCTLEGLPSSDAKTVIMNCACSQAYTGRYCEEDRDGCSAVQCYVESSCRDVPAPGVGAECGPCPIGFTGDGSKCLDIDECQVNSSVCNQVCTNSAGSYTCSCEQGYKLNTDNQCIDVNECLTTNDCQQQCTNTEGGYNCSCSQGFTLNSDNKTCDALEECATNHGCSDGCAIVNNTQQCFCPSGYALDITQCTDINECSMFNPCEQVCINTNGSYQCSCRNGFSLKNDNSTCQDLNECMQAALNGSSLCSANSECVNTHGSYQCDCVPGYDLTNGTCHRIEEEPTTPPQIVPNFAQDNTYSFTITSLDIAFKQARQQLFRVTTAMVINEYCSINLCTIVPSNGDLPARISGLSVSEQDVAIPNSLFSRNAQGQLVVGFYIQTQQGFVALATIQQSVMAGEKHYQDAGFTLVSTPSPSIVDVSIIITSSSIVQEISTSPVTMVTSTPPPVARGVSALAVPLGAVGGAVVLGIVVAIIVITVVCVKHSKLPKATNSTTENTYITINTEKKDAIEMGGFSNAAVVELKS